MAAYGAVGVSNVVLLQFFNVLGIDRGDDEFDSDVGDRELLPPFSPEDVLVRFEGQLIESGCVLFIALLNLMGCEMLQSMRVLSVARERALLGRASGRQTWRPPQAVVRMVAQDFAICDSRRSTFSVLGWPRRWSTIFVMMTARTASAMAASEGPWDIFI